ncbi:hypothetical protein BGZ96_005561, partial [Linnemannia gamsii]
FQNRIPFHHLNKNQETKNQETKNQETKNQEIKNQEFKATKIPISELLLVPLDGSPYLQYAFCCLYDIAAAATARTAVARTTSPLVKVMPATPSTTMTYGREN